MSEFQIRLLEDLPQWARKDIAQASASPEPMSFWIRFVPLVLLYLFFYLPMVVAIAGDLAHEQTLPITNAVL